MTRPCGRASHTAGQIGENTMKKCEVIFTFTAGALLALVAWHTVQRVRLNHAVAVAWARSEGYAEAIDKQLARLKARGGVGGDS